MWQLIVGKICFGNIAEKNCLNFYQKYFFYVQVYRKFKTKVNFSKKCLFFQSLWYTL